MVKVLFVCLGNICRSPMAEAVFRHKVNEVGLADKIMVDSAGTASWHEGKQPHDGTRAKLDDLAISYAGQVARQLKQTDFDEFNYIIVMDESNLNDVRKTFSISNKIVVKKLLSYQKNSNVTDVPDPYYTGDFDYTYELINDASDQLLQEIIKEHLS